MLALCCHCGSAVCSEKTADVMKKGGNGVDFFSKADLSFLFSLSRAVVYIGLCTFSGDARLDCFDHCLNRLSVSCV